MASPMKPVRAAQAAGGSRMGRRQFLALVGAGAAGLATGCLGQGQAAPAGRRPNIILIVADDLGYADVGFQGCPDIPTPHLDALARGGVRFTSGYVSCPVCSPTRAGLMTGRYQQRFGHEFNPGPPPNPDGVGLPLGETTLPDVLKAAGYATGMVGKWHLGTEPKFHPLARGFQEFYGFLGGAHPYTKLAPQGPNPILRGTQPVAETEYLTDAFAREAVAFIDRNRRGPFFLYLPFNAVHTPLDAVAKYLDRFPGIADARRRTYAAMLSAMDDAVGAVLAKVREAGLDHDTLVIFFSDNGGPPRANASRNDPLRGAKGQTYEGGIRVPFLMRWTGRLPEGKTFDHPVISLDVLPTAAAAAGAKAPAGLDGVDLLPYLAGGKDGPPHETLFWRMGPERKAVRRGNLKYVRMDGKDQLYDLAADIAESKDLAEAQPDRLKALQDACARWEAELKQPLWGGGAARRRQNAATRPRNAARARQAAPAPAGGP